MGVRDMKKKNRTRVSLLVYEYPEDFAKLTEFLQIKPTFVHEPKSGSTEFRRWELRSGVAESEAFEKHLDALLEKLAPSATQLRELSKKYRCLISVGLDYYEFNPEIDLTHEALQALADLGVSLWLDIYNLFDAEGPEGQAEYHMHK